MSRVVRPFLTVLVAIGLIAMAYVALRSERVPPAGEPTVDDVVDVPPRSAPDAAATELAAAAAAAPAAPDAAPRTEFAPRNPPLPDGARVVDVVVVDRASDAPLPDVEITWDDGSVLQRLATLSPDARRQWQQAAMRGDATLGWKGRTNADGVLRVHVGPTGARLFAKFAGTVVVHSLEAAAEGPPARHRFVVDRPREWVVRVVDADGRPAFGVPIALSRFDPDRSFGQAKFAPIAPTTTAPNGEVSLGDLRRFVGSPNEGTPTDGWRLYVATPGLTDVAAPVDPHEPPSQPIELRLPPTGSVAVRLVVGGKPVLGDALCLIAADASEPTPPSSFHAASDDGWTRFSHVPLASRFAARTEDRNVNFVSPPFDGPARRGEAVRFEFEPPSSLLTWTGRVLDGGGNPFARARIAVDVPRESSRERVTVTTTADGRFVVFPDRVHRRVGGPVRISHHAAGGVEQSCIASPRVIRVGVADFGDLTLAPSPIVVAGRFRFGSGRPGVVPFTVERFEVGRVTNPEGQFERVGGVRIVTETDGRFVVYGDLEPARHRLTFKSRTYLPREPFEFELGARDVEIDIDFGASLAAFGRVPQPWPAAPSGVSAVLRRVGAGGVGVADVGAPWPAVNRYRADPEIGPDIVTFEWRAIEAGTYVMEFRVDGFHDPVWTIRDVVVPSPEGGDPRLRGIDLREHLSVVTLEVVPRTNDAQEAIRVLLSGPMAFPIPQPPNVEWFGRPFDGMQLTMVVPRRGAHLLIVSKEVPRELRDVRDGQRFTPDPWPEVECAFAELGALPDGVRLLARFAADPDLVLPRYRLSQGPSGVLHALHPSSVWNAVENGTVRLPIGTTPRRLELSLRRNGTNSGPTVAHDTPPIAPGTERVDVRIAPEAWERALTEVQQPPARGRR